ncbi:hypothetical protein AKL17_3436 [Frigidibacter mobilis]|uniref:Uncharacterized protein n=1 Tax=Frigidibacter mobilis TaxID=1335048 RepID=A0A159Z5V2_9RHOB|nr:hypothetical protein AKL17_3436 [Frigidibacter mobilis]
MTGAAGADPNVGFCPQITLRSRVTRGTQVVCPAYPARMNTQPLLSTYWAPAKLAGGYSAGPSTSSKVTAPTDPTPNAAANTAAESNLATRIS